MKLFEVTPVRPVEVKVMVALVTAAALVAERLLKVADPLTAATVVVPPNVQLPTSPLAAVTLTVLVVAFPY